MSGRVVTLGEALGMIRVAGPDGFELAESARLGTGGAEANVAIGLARLGHDAAWLGRVGDDELGARVRRQLRAEGVETHAVTDREAPTGLMLKDASHPERTVVRFYRAGSAGSRLAPADLDRLRIADAAWLHVTGIPLALSASAADAVLGAVDIARAHGVGVSFDVNHRARLWDYPTAVPRYREVVSRADVVFGGDDELGAVVGVDGAPGSPAELARAVLALGPTEAVLKRGARGAGVATPAGWEWRDAVPVAVADTVGAGDAFVAGYLSARLEGRAPGAALDRAVRAGAAACRHPGDWEGALRAADLDPVEGDPVLR
ncbi:sugar kinase [Streptomyces hainanensis]|nr:sugar kinase [Streptomyces hainanensis]